MIYQMSNEHNNRLATLGKQNPSTPVAVFDELGSVCRILATIRVLSSPAQSQLPTKPCHGIVHAANRWLILQGAHGWTTLLLSAMLPDDKPVKPLPQNGKASRQRARRSRSCA